MLNYDVKDLRLFTLAAHHGNLKVAAEHMFMTVSAASLRIKKLEELFKVQFFIRKARGVVLTDAGEKFLEDAKMMLAQNENIQKHMDEYSQFEDNTIRLYTNYSGMVGGFRRDVGGFLKANPDLNIDFVLRPTHGVIEAMQEGVADIGIVSYENNEEGLQFFPYFEDAFVFLTMKDNPRAKGLNSPLYLADLTDFPIVSLNREIISQGYFEQKAKELGIRLNVRARFPSLHSGIETMQEIEGGLLTLESTSITKLPGFKMYQLADSWAKQDIRICLPVDMHRVKPAAETFVKYLLARKKKKE